MRNVFRLSVMLGVAAVLMCAAVTSVALAVSKPAEQPVRPALADGGMTLKLTSTQPGVTFDGGTLVCPPVEIQTSSGRASDACQFTISSVGDVLPETLTVSMRVTGLSPAQVGAGKFAIEPEPGKLVHAQPSEQTVYTFTGASLPLTLSPGIAWGAAAGTPLDNGDLGARLVVTYAVLAESAEGATASPHPSSTPGPTESVGGVTFAPGPTASPPPTTSSSDLWAGYSSQMLLPLIALALGCLGLVAVWSRRRRSDSR